jgi:KaiC/GvpD/RAD55 family RecA-like ATPase
MTHDEEARTQIESALDNLYRPDGDWVAWPWPDLTELVGRMKPRDIWFVCGFSGNGKTLFVSSAIQEFIKQKVRTYVMPLETSADDFRMYLACQNVGIDPGILNSGGFLDMVDTTREYWETQIEKEMQRQLDDEDFHQFVKIKGVDAVNIARLTLAAKEAAEWNAKILIVDHIDHIEGDGKNTYQDSLAVVKGAHKLAKRYNLTFLFTSQMNNEMIKGNRDRLAQFAPPLPTYVYMGSHKRMYATGMIGLHRRVRDPHPNETPDEFAAAVKKSRDGDSPPLDALQPGVMAVTAMKLRNNGKREGERCFLAVEHGRVLHLSEKDRTSTHPAALRRL